MTDFFSIIFLVVLGQGEFSTNNDHFYSKIKQREQYVYAMKFKNKVEAEKCDCDEVARKDCLMRFNRKTNVLEIKTKLKRVNIFCWVKYGSLENWELKK